MWSVFKHTIKESFHRRMAVALLTVSACVFVALVWLSRFSPGPNDSVLISVLGRNPEDAVNFVLNSYGMLLNLTSGLMFFVAMFAAAPLLVSYLDKGMAEWLFAKGLARWQIFLGRVFGAFGVFLAAMMTINVFPALYYWLRAGITPRYFLTGVLVLCVSFLGMLCLMALISAFQPSVATMITAGFLDLIISSILLSRTAWYQILPYEWIRKGMDALYTMLPKHEELSHMAQSYLNLGNVKSWMPLWTTLAFCAVALTLAALQIRRKSF